MAIAQRIQGIQHIGIPTNNLDATIGFFESLGFQVAFRRNGGAEPVAFLAQKSLMIEAYQNGMAVGKPGAIDHIALDVDDIDQALLDVQALGYPALEGTVQSLPFWEHGVKFFTISGPDGEKVEFSQKL